MTVAAWVNISSVPTEWTGIVTKGNTAWRLSTYRAERRFHFSICGVGLGLTFVHGETDVSAGNWHHVCGTFDGSRIRLYVDGVEDPGSPQKVSWGRMTTNDLPVCIGGNSEKPGRCWDGLIDDVRIYRHALSETEVKALHDSSE
jgi:hypothetical protein